MSFRVVTNSMTLIDLEPM